VKFQVWTEDSVLVGEGKRKAFPKKKKKPSKPAL